MKMYLEAIELPFLAYTVKKARQSGVRQAHRPLPTTFDSK
jgi:hypothetical protein